MLEVREKRSVLCDDRSIPVEFVVHADQHGLHARSIDESLTRNVGRGRVEVLREIILGPDVVPLREHRPVWRKHPFAADAGGESGLPEGRRLEKWSAARKEYLIAVLQEGNAELREALLAAVTDLWSAGLVLERERRRIRHFGGRGFIRGGEGR